MRKIFSLLFLIISYNGYSQGIKYTKDDTIRYIVKNEIPRFFAGTFWTGVEFPLKNKKSIYVSGIATYGSNFDSDKELIGYGAEFQYRSYLGKGSFTTNYPIYMAAQLMYRHIDRYERKVSSYVTDPVSFESSPIYTEGKDAFNVYYAGLLIGCQIFVNQIFTVDLNFGGGLRLSQATDSKSFTKYKNISNLDYSGVVPRVGVVIGIIQH
ncbi:MAG: hypothetical protein ACK48V_00965 [Crocinitomicaceae bacterium]|jgi:hypothetical protein